MKLSGQILTASVLGTIAYKEGKLRVPAKDSGLLEMIKGRRVGETPDGEASTIRLMEAWLEAWDNAKYAQEQSNNK